MTRILPALILAFTSVHASAASWPWQTSTGEEPVGYCRGFVAGGLASNEVAERSRVDLWLAWSYMIRLGPVGRGPEGKGYQEGLKHFQTAAAATTAQSVIHQADGECGLGKSGHQITGW